jgi:hypothetical protein
MEYMAVATSHYDMDRFGAGLPRFSPRQADVLLVVGTVSHKIAPILRRYMPATAMFNMSGQPAMSVPLAWNAAGLPLGMMFSAKFGDEGTLFRLAGQLEQARPWKDKLPPVCSYSSATRGSSSSRTSPTR